MRSRRGALALGLWLSGLASAALATDDGSCPSLDRTKSAPPVRTGRPTQLVDHLPEGALRARLERCLGEAPGRGSRTIGHRGAPLRYPEHTLESYLAAARLGAGVVECDVTPTRDGHLLCRHDACDLHRTTNILQTPLASRCRTPFQAAVEEAAGGPGSQRHAAVPWISTWRN